MYSCRDCETIFNQVETIKDDTGELLNVCPGCNSTGYEEAYKCDLCERYYFEEQIHNNICYKCAEKEYTDRLGLKWLDKHKEYFLEIWGIGNVDKELESDLIEVLEKDFLSKVDLDGDSNKQLEHLKNYILDDMENWIEFLREEII
jgi:hypothetical protein